MREFRSSERSNIWINGGYFVLRPEIFDYMNEGEELVLEPFLRLIEADQLMAYKHEGFWRCMDNLQGPAGARGDGRAGQDAVARQRCRQAEQDPVDRQPMRALHLAQPDETLSVLCLGAHSDDIEIGAGGTILGWIASGVRLEIDWCVLSATGPRAAEAKASAAAFLAGAASSKIELGQFDDSFFPYQGDEIKAWLKAVRPTSSPTSS